MLPNHVLARSVEYFDIDTLLSFRTTCNRFNYIITKDILKHIIPVDKVFRSSLFGTKKTSNEYKKWTEYALMNKLKYYGFLIYDDWPMIKHIFTHACRNGFITVCEILIKKEYNFQYGEISKWIMENIIHLFEPQCAAILRMLLSPPFTFIETEEISQELLRDILNILLIHSTSELVDIISHPFFRIETLNNSYKILNDLCIDGKNKLFKLIAERTDISILLTNRTKRNTLIKRVCSNGKSKALKMLAKPPFNFRRKDIMGEGSTNLYIACNYGHYNIIKILLNPPYSLYKCDFEQKTKHLYSPVDILKINNCTRILELLTSHLII